VAALWHHNLAKSIAVPLPIDKSAIHEEVLQEEQAVKFEIPSSPAKDKTTDTVTVPMQSIKFTKKKRVVDDEERHEDDEHKKRHFLRWSMPNKKNIFKSFARRKSPKIVEEPVQQDNEPITVRRMYYNQLQQQTRTNIFNNESTQKYYREWSSDEHDADQEDASNDNDEASDLSDEEHTQTQPVKHKKFRKYKKREKYKPEQQVEEDEPTELENQLNEAIDDEASFSESLSDKQRAEITQPHMQGHLSPTLSLTPIGTLNTLQSKSINLKCAIDLDDDELVTPRERLIVEPSSKFISSNLFQRLT